MELFEEVFNRASIYDSFFMNIKGVLEYPTLDILKTDNPVLCERWKCLSETKYNQRITEIKAVPSIITSHEDALQLIQNDVYEKNAVFHPEFTRIVAITYANLYSKNGKTERFFKKIVSEDEFTILATFMDVLYQMSANGIQSTPNYFPAFCGHNITNYDIPLLIKRFIKHREQFRENLKANEILRLPLNLKRLLMAKPWDGVTIDTVNVWKFGGTESATLMQIADFLSLKKTIDCDELSEVSKKYWSMVSEKPKEALDYVTAQSATQTNLVIQLMHELSQY
jgi:hypothetical protein